MRSRSAPNAWLVRAATIAGVLCVASLVQACPGCKEGMASQKGGGDLVSAFMWSILFMLSVPLTIVTAFGIYVYRNARRLQRQPPSSGAAAVPAPAPTAEARELVEV